MRVDDVTSFFFCNRMSRRKRERESGGRGREGGGPGGATKEPKSTGSSFMLRPEAKDPRLSLCRAAASCAGIFVRLRQIRLCKDVVDVVLRTSARYLGPSSERAAQHILPLFPPSHHAPPSQSRRTNSPSPNQRVSIPGGAVTGRSTCRRRRWRFSSG